MQDALATTLEKLDPAEAWKPWQGEPFTLRWAAHLLRRAAFGAPAFDPQRGTWEGMQQAVKQGLDATLDQLFAGGPGQAEFDQLLNAVAVQFAEDRPGDLGELQGWWLYRILYSPHPLREKLTLFWHNHFATSYAKVQQRGPMLRQNQALRQHALGNFRTLVLEMSRDPAMLLWLDSNANVKGQPNENFARELMELFTLGVGHYTEHDVREAARAFTGWHASGTAFAFNKEMHDDGPKTILGQTGRWQGADVVRIILEQSATARFVVRKLFREFISEVDPPGPLLEPLAVQFRRDYDLGSLLRTMLRSRLFFSGYAYRRRIKSPIEHAAGLVRALDERIALTQLAGLLTGVGQTLFAPPNVKGWKGGKAWLNSATLLVRHNLAWELAGGQRPSLPQLVRKHSGPSAREQVGFCVDLFLQGDVGEPARQKLVDFLAGKAAPGDGKDDRLRAAAHAVLLIPEYQLS